MAEWKDTLNLPRTDFPMKASLTTAEPQALARWQEMGLYAQIQQRRQGRPRFILHDGPPYANGRIHLGTAMNKILKDLVVKSRSMMGFDAPYILGYDCHGLPIELKVDRELGPKKREMSVADFRRACRAYATRFIDVMSVEFQRLGVFGDWEHLYLTMDFKYQAAIARALGRFVEQGLVYKGKKPVHWCIHCRTALAEAEVEYEDHTSPSIYVEFPLAPESAERTRRARAGAGRPPGLGPDLDDDPVDHPVEPGDRLPSGRRLRRLRRRRPGRDPGRAARRRRSAEKTGRPLGAPVVRMKGAELEHIRFQHPLYARPSLGVLADYVTVEQGTGAVHTAPGHGSDDFKTGVKYGLEIYAPVGPGGHFLQNVELFGGKRVFDANPEVEAALAERGRLWHREPFHHTYPHCWRCHNPVIFLATSQWFIAMDGARRAPNGSGPGIRDRTGAARSRGPDPGSAIPTMRRGVRTCEARSTPSITGPLGAADRPRSHHEHGRQPARLVHLAPARLGRADPGGRLHRLRRSAAHAGGGRSRGGGVRHLRRRRAGTSGRSKSSCPAGLTCPSCGGTAFEREGDILDVWFDSGSSHEAVLPFRPELRLAGRRLSRRQRPASRLVPELAAGRPGHPRPAAVQARSSPTASSSPKTAARCPSRSATRSSRRTSSRRAAPRSSACGSTMVDYREEVRLGKQILARVVEAYRKIRNTCRYLAGEPVRLRSGDRSRAARPAAGGRSLRRWRATPTSARVGARGLRAYDFPTIFQRGQPSRDGRSQRVLRRRFEGSALHVRRGVAGAALGADRDVRHRRRAGPPARADPADDRRRAVAAPARHARGVGAHRASSRPTPSVDAMLDAELVDRWERLEGVRDEVNAALEARGRTRRSAPRSARRSRCRAGGETPALLEQHRAELPMLFIVSQVALRRDRCGRRSARGRGRARRRRQVRALLARGRRDLVRRRRPRACAIAASAQSRPPA